MYSKIKFSLLCLLGTSVLVSCIPQSSRFGVIFTNNNADIYRIPDNMKSEVEQLTFTPEVGEYPFLVSKNGEEIIFEVGLTGNADEVQQNVYKLNTSNKKITNITNVFTPSAMVQHYFSADWWPDGTQFVTTDYGGSGYEIESYLELVDFNGENKRKIHISTPQDIPSLIQSVDWSPDGKKFILTRVVIGSEQQLKYPGSAILVYFLESGKLVQITDYLDGCLPGGWSPNNRQIVAICRSNIPYMIDSTMFLPDTIRIFDIEKPEQPYEHIAFTSCDDPSWSPDGKQIAFVCNKSNNRRGLFIVNSDGNGIHEIKPGNLENPEILHTPIWSPDGTQIVYVAGIDNLHINIHTINLLNSVDNILTNLNDNYRLEAVYSLP
jgi:dipeptidyl aminopeptidase/acylaminoacyl peptidase